ncbi:hypothetical protein C2G38_2096432 [Gigaspora rosea]|uniref:Uncharacterized protein n=1 Tax=Gigaspora rosea TaxID=44941 RepID=A0A397V4I9_9GLOM|nr:hypothetical protein C2G38_2096432 [Gigaspora rosea]
MNMMPSDIFSFNNLTVTKLKSQSFQYNKFLMNILNFSIVEFIILFCLNQLS